MLCESCNEQEATCHITTIAGDAMQKRDLCAACFAITFPDNFPEGTPRSPSFSPDARCEYCGRAPCITGGDILATATGSQSSKIHVHRVFLRAQPVCSKAFAWGIRKAFQ